MCTCVRDSAAFCFGATRRKSALAEALAQRGTGSAGGQRKRLENRGMALPRVDKKTPFEEWACSFRDFTRMANKDAAEMMTKLVEDERVWHSGILAGIAERFAQADVEEVSADLCGLLV